MINIFIAFLVLALASEACVDKAADGYCKKGKANKQCGDPEFAKNCELTCSNCCDISEWEECYEAKSRGECYNKLFNRCDKMCGHCANF